MPGNQILGFNFNANVKLIGGVIVGNRHVCSVFDVATSNKTSRPYLFIGGRIFRAKTNNNVRSLARLSGRGEVVD